MNAPAAERFRGLQALRYLAALAVVWAHANDTALALGLPAGVLGAGGLRDFGAIGVDVFFVISGFIIVRTAWNGPDRSAAGFFARRWLRVAPVYFLVSLPWAAAAIAQGGFEWRSLVATFLFWPSFGDGLAFPFLLVGWTLCFEMLFYAAVALTLTAGGRLVTPGRMVGAFALCVCGAVVIGGPVFGFLGSPLILEFLFGAAIAVGNQRARRWGAAAPWCALAAAAAGLITAASLDPFVVDGAELASAATWWRVLFWGLPAALLVFATVHLEPLLPDAVWTRCAARLGDASYSLYLVHLPVLLLMQAMAARLNLAPGGDLFVLVALPVSTAVGLLAFRLVERPLTAALGRRGRPRRVSPLRPAIVGAP